jgi:DUF4097 and DUF4098 domain-containing protein YvlB
VVAGKLTGTFHRPQLNYRTSAGGLQLDPRCRVGIGICSIQFTIGAPASLPVSVSDSFGNLQAGNLRGRVDLSDNSGDLAVSALTGTIRLNDSFGNITARNLAGSILLVNNSGDIQASGVTGNTQVRDSFGNIDITGLSAADVTASNNSGDVVLSFSRVPDNVQITDAFGNVTLELPPGSATYRVHAQTTFGNRTVSVPQSASATHVITVTNNSGDITIANEPGPAPSAPSAPRGPSAPANPSGG